MKLFTSKDKLYTGGAVLSLLIIWEVIARTVGASILLPPPGETWRELVLILHSENFLPAVISTTTRSLVGFGLTFLTAVVFAVLAGLWKPLYYLFSPLVVITKAAPPISVILLALIWLGTEKAPVLVGFLVIFPIIYTNIIAGVDNVDPKLIEMAAMYKVRRLRMILDVYLPAVMPYVLAACSTALGLNLRVVIMAEVLSQPPVSMGSSLQSARVFLNTAGVFAWTTVAVALAALFDFGVFSLRKKVEAWK
ncbi:MAG: putative aliphatic sulfonates transport permease protein SsuC [Firmicutes bacterium]|nr:putative aliphatic sulfonates transport permease protein SsuC [Bacillota bacterium]